jgi:hypothetical protein
MLSVAKATFSVSDPVCDYSLTLPAERGRVCVLISSALVRVACLLGVRQTRSTTAASRLCNFTCVAPNLDRVATQCGLGLSAGVCPNAIPTLYSESPSNSALAIVGGPFGLRFVSKCDQNRAMRTKLPGLTHKKFETECKEFPQANFHTVIGSRLSCSLSNTWPSGRQVFQKTETSQFGQTYRKYNA